MKHLRLLCLVCALALAVASCAALPNDKPEVVYFTDEHGSVVFSEQYINGSIMPTTDNNSTTETQSLIKPKAELTLKESDNFSLILLDKIMKHENFDADGVKNIYFAVGGWNWLFSSQDDTLTSFV